MVAVVSMIINNILEGYLTKNVILNSIVLLFSIKANYHQHRESRLDGNIFC
jgi:hypothetical protein